MTPERLRVLLRRTDLSGIYQLPSESIESLRQTAETLGFASFQIDLRRVRTQTAALKILGRGLGFPDWYGANLDALNDCLTDFSWNEAPGYVVILSGAAAVHAVGEPFAHINEVFDNAIDAWRQQNVPFWILFDLHTAGLPGLPDTA